MALTWMDSVSLCIESWMPGPTCNCDIHAKTHLMRSLPNQKEHEFDLARYILSQLSLFFYRTSKLTKAIARRVTIQYRNEYAVSLALDTIM